jgi:hypothetical protein
MKRILIGSALGSALIGGMLTIAAHAAPPIAPMEHFTARAVEATAPARITFRPVDIMITRWSTFMDHLQLSRTLAEHGHVAFLSTLCGFSPVGTLSVLGGVDMPIRYAWSFEGRDGSRRIYLATDQPISLTNELARRNADAEPLTFLELRINKNGEGEGKLSEAARLLVDESRNVIELRDYPNRPLHLLMVRSAASFEE